MSIATRIEDLEMLYLKDILKNPPSEVERVAIISVLETIHHDGKQVGDLLEYYENLEKEWVIDEAYAICVDIIKHYLRKLTDVIQTTESTDSDELPSG